MTGSGSALSPARAKVVRRAAASLERAAGGLAEEVAARIRVQVPELAHDRRLTGSCHSNIALKLSMLRAGVPGARAQAPAEARRYARDVAARGGDLSALLHAYRVGHGFFWRTWTDAIARVEDPPKLAELGLGERSAAFLIDWFDAVCGQIEAEYRFARAGGASARATPRDLVRSMLAGEATDVDAASRMLGYDLRRRHLALVLQRGAAGAQRARAAGELARAGRALASALGSGEPLLVPCGASSLWAWVACDGDLDSEALEQAAGDPALLGTEIAVGVGEPGVGLEGFRESHDEARQALRVAKLGQRRRRRPVRYASVAVAALLSADAGRAQRFVERELGALAAPDDTTARLRATLRIYLEEGSNQARTARRLGIHYNTVAYRIRRAEELLGRPISVRRFELEAALALANALEA
jgi:DNA-binding PucR family transcriptional regulator